MDHQSIKKKNVIITGCNKGIGKATLEDFAKYRANIFACVRSNTQNFKNFVSKLKKNTSYKLDVHVMLQENTRFVERVIEYGADLVTVHCESTDINEFKNLTTNFDNVGIGILPTSNIEILKSYAEYTSIFLLLTVNPGFSNQPKAVNLIDRINEFKSVVHNSESTLIVDGGVTVDDLAPLETNGVNVAVQGGAIFGK